MCSTTTKAYMDTSNPVERAADPREFIRLLMENERRIYAYLLTLLGNSANAEDVLQETSIILWDKFAEFNPKLPSEPNPNQQPTNCFLAWSLKVAYYAAQNFRRKQGRSRVTFSNALFDAVAETTPALIPQLDVRHEILADCIEKLPEGDRKLLQLRYQHGASIESTAENSGRSVQAVYKALSRLRAALFQCVNSGMSMESQS